MIQVRLNVADKSNVLSGDAENNVLQCCVHNLPIRERIKENLTLVLDFSLIFITNTRVLIHPLPSQSNIDRGQPAVGAGREVREDEHSDEGGKDCQSTIDVE